MNVNGILNIIRREAARVIDQQANTRMAIVDSYDPDLYCAKVRIQPEDPENPANSLTGFLPISTPFVGNGWGIVCPPTVGDVVDVHFQEWGKNAGYISQRFYNIKSPPPGPAASGEFWLIHQSGSLLKFTNDGNVQLIAHADLNVTVGGNLNATVRGGTNLRSAQDVNITAPNLNVDGNITATGDITDQTGTTNESMRDQRALYDSHTHPGVQGGPDNTGVPNQQA